MAKGDAVQLKTIGNKRGVTGIELRRPQREAILPIDSVTMADKICCFTSKSPPPVPPIEVSYLRSK